MAPGDRPRDVGAGAWAEWALASAAPVAVFLALNAYLVGRHLADREIVRDGRPALAVAVERDVRPDRHGRPRDFARLAWTVDGRRWRGWFPLDRAVDRARVRYAPSWPARAVIDDGSAPRDPSPLAVLAPGALFGAALLAPVVALYRRRVAAARRLLREGAASPGELTSWSLDRVTVVAEGREGTWRFPPWLAAPPPVGAAVTVLRDPRDDTAAAPLEALRPTPAPARALALAAADALALAGFAWVYLRDLAP